MPSSFMLAHNLKVVRLHRSNTTERQTISLREKGLFDKGVGETVLTLSKKEPSDYLK